MALETKSIWRPDWIVTPGDILLEALEDRSMTQSELARRAGRPIKTINEIVHGKAAITPETALQFEHVLGISASFWNGAEIAYRGTLARREAIKTLELSVDWLEGFPTADMINYKLIPQCPSKVEAVDVLLRFFGVSSPSVWQQLWLTPNALYRTTPAFQSDPKAISAWLRWGEIEAKTLELPPFESSNFRKVLNSAKRLTRAWPIGPTIKRLQSLCLESGVALVLTPELGKGRLTGAAWWVDGKPLIQLTDRYKSDDHFWFTFFHEAGHILQISKRRVFVDEAMEELRRDISDSEAMANQFARDLLISPKAYSDFVSTCIFSRTTVTEFAREQGVAAGIVIGRLQSDEFVGFQQLNDLKRKIQFSA